MYFKPHSFSCQARSLGSWLRRSLTPLRPCNRHRHRDLLSPLRGACLPEPHFLSTLSHVSTGVRTSSQHPGLSVYRRVILPLNTRSHVYREPYFLSTQHRVQPLCAAAPGPEPRLTRSAVEGQSPRSRRRCLRWGRIQNLFY